MARNTARKISLLAWVERLAFSVSYLELCSARTTRNVGLPRTIVSVGPRLTLVSLVISVILSWKRDGQRTLVI